MVCELLLRAAGLPELGRLQRREDIEVTSQSDRARQRRQLLESAGTVASFPDAPAEKSDPQLGRRSPPLETIGTGARRLALRGEGRCIVCGEARPEGRHLDYCSDHRQRLTDRERRQHKREIKVALDWAAPVVAGGQSRADARRSRRTVSGHAGDML